ncbi:MAG: sugar nucleotide-binding protein, partial [Microbacterium sp.]
EGHNFVRTMASLAQRGINPNVVNDQTGRLTFTTDIAAGIHHLLHAHAEHGTYNLTGSGHPTTWADIARTVFETTGHDPARITGVTTHEYFATATGPTAPRPHNSTLDLAKLESTGMRTPDADRSLRAYLSH